MGPLKAQEPAPIRSGFLFCGKQQSLLELLEAKKKPPLLLAEVGFVAFSGAVRPGRFAQQINPGMTARKKDQFTIKGKLFFTRCKVFYTFVKNN